MKKRNTVGLDMGDKIHAICELDAGGQVLERGEVGNTGIAIRKRFAKMKPWSGGDGSGNAFGLGEPDSGRAGARSAGGESAQAADDLG